MTQTESSQAGGKHRHYFGACTVSYWNEGVAARDSEPWTHRRIETLRPVSRSLDFVGTDEGNARFQMTMWMLEDAWAAGMRHQRQLVKEVLGIKDPRS